jgi:prepilin-type N-terminal cleavage/methylation domain-containing protein
MNPHLHPSRKAKGGFTLVEILVSMVVLGLMMVGVAQMMNSALSASLGGYKHMDADTQARIVLDRMAFDISRMTKRTDVDYYFQKNTTSSGSIPGNDQMAFYSESGGYYPSGVTAANGGASDVSLVGYMIAPMLNGVYTTIASGGTPQLVRLSKGLGWNGFNTSNPAMVFNPLANSPANPYASTPITSNTITNTWSGVSTGQDSNYQVIGDQVFRLEYCFLVQSATNTVVPTATAPDFYDNPWSTHPDLTPTGLQNVTAIIVSIAVLDTKSRAIVTNSQLQTAASYLPDDGFTSLSTTTSNLPLPRWKAALTTALGSGGNSLGLPTAAASQIRFYQRYCYLNHLQ